MDIPGIGSFILESGPSGPALWSLARPVASALYAEPVPVNVVLESTESPDDVDLALVTAVLSSLDDHIGRALTFVHGRLLVDPSSFGLTSASPYVTVDDVPVDLPQVNFYVGDEWILHFQRGRLPICEPYGMGVVFSRHNPVRIDDLTDAEDVD